MKIKAIYDNGGKTFDRYTVYYDERQGNRDSKTYLCRGMSAHPYHPQGYGQMGSGMLGRHNGKRIRLEALPKDCQLAVKSDLE